MGKEARQRSYILKREIRKRLIQEKNVVVLFIVALGYSLISNIISKCCPIECDVEMANLGNAIDELLRNICYGFLAGIIFYIINDVYKNVVRRIPEMDRMFYELLKLQVNANLILQTISDNTYDGSMNRERTFQCVMKYLCNEDVDFHVFGSFVKKHTVNIENCIVLVNSWKEANRMRSDFLGAFGDLLEREEIYSLNNFDDNLISDVIRILDIQIENTNKEFVQVSDHDITILVNRIIGYKIYLTDIAKKYVDYAYRIIYLDRPCIREDIR